jgi:MerR family transcriptional regulator, mercuric resistance operon regulatory protein
MRGMAGLLIGEVAQPAGVSAPTIRYYEEIGLLAKPSRSATGYRRYSESTVQELKFIRKAQALGFSLDEIGEILKLSRSGELPCSHVRSLAHQHLAAVEGRIRQLQQFRDELAAEVTKWDEQQTAITCEGLCQFIADATTPSTGEIANIPMVPESQRAARGRGND